ncbi:hypothetical protein [Pseudomonas sp. MPC6]|uniref:hypothetical protein n=1 Tax=unclassified Pseudomonas TaxID=196821 RepID=UPI0015B0D708|nr:hypothetical protein [Pseudomonas sp. MPC6]
MTDTQHSLASQLLQGSSVDMGFDIRRLLPIPKRCMSVKALSLFVTGHYPYTRQAETLPPPASSLLLSVHPRKRSRISSLCLIFNLREIALSA